MAPIRVYARVAGRFFAMSCVVTRQFLHYLPHRISLVPATKEQKEIRKYLKTKRPRISSPYAVKETLEKLGPTFVKFGQFLSIRTDLVSCEYFREFRKLQDNVPPFSFDFTKVEIERELGQSCSELFTEIDEIPVAAASVSQVHRARLKTGEEVAVKVQRPGVREEMETDILLMSFLIPLAERFIPSIRKNKPRVLVREFSKWTERELDFRKEGRNALQFAYYFQDYPTIKFPQVYLEFTTEKVLVMEFIKGTNIRDISGEEAKNRVARLTADSMLKQIFVDGFFHGDPHPGNLFLLDGNTLAYLDFGIVGYWPSELREWSFDILYGMTEGNIPRIIDSFLEICRVKPDEVDLASYRREMNEVLCELHVCKIARVPLSSMLEKFMNISLSYGIDVPSDFVILTKAIGTLEGTCMLLAPDITILDYLKPFVEKNMVALPKFGDMVGRLKTAPFEMERLSRLVSTHVRKTMEFIENPIFRIESGEFRHLVREFDKSSVNISYGVIIAALIIFAATLSNESAFERWLRGFFHLPLVPLLPIVSLIVAGYLCLRLYLRNRFKKNKE